MLLLTAVVVCGIASWAYAATVNLAWDANTEPDLAGYKVHYGLASRTYTTHLDVGNTVAYTVTSLAASTRYYFALTAYDSYGNESAYSNEVSFTTPAAGAETISAPLAPSGPTSGVVGRAYTYTTGGAVSSAGHPVQYRFSWSDGSVSEWLPAASASASKTWNTPGTYTQVRAEARCGLDPSIVSVASATRTVTISTGAPETISAPSVPAGPTGGNRNVRYAFSAGGAASSDGHAIRYRFHWGDGTASNWIEPGQPVKAAKSWSVPGTYVVQTEAVCAADSTVGAFSRAFEISIVNGINYLPIGCVMLNAPGAKLDFDGDGRDDVGCYSPAEGNWYIVGSRDGLWKTQFGFAGTIPVTGDFDGDGKSDIGVYYPPGGNWYILKSKEGFMQTQFGYAGTVPVVGDFDGDGRDDIGCYYAPGGNWYIFMSSKGFWETQFGYAGTDPIVGDFDGDGKSDFGCYYPPGGNWYVFKSSEGFWQTQFGYLGTKPVVGDFDGDGRSDFGCYHPPSGNWYVLKSSEGFLQTQFGYAGMEPVTGDFDGDGKSDYGVYYPLDGNWSTLTSGMAP